MAAKTTYLQNKINEHVVKNTSYTSPTTVYAALCKSDPTVAGNNTAPDGTVDDTAYARQAITFGASSSGVIANTGAVTFPAVVYGTGGVSYNVTHFAIYDALTTGNMLYFKALPATETMTTGKSLTFPIGTISITET